MVEEQARPGLETGCPIRCDRRPSFLRALRRLQRCRDTPLRMAVECRVFSYRAEIVDISRDVYVHVSRPQLVARGRVLLLLFIAICFRG